MSNSVKKIPATAVEKGMYVAKLDRDWLDTPFPFQGFYITNNEEIERLKSTCEYIYVDTERHDEGVKLYSTTKFIDDDFEHGQASTGVDPSPTGRQRQHGTTALSETFLGEIANSKSFLRKVSSILVKMRPKPSVGKELNQAGEIFRTANDTVSNVMGELRDGGKLDIAAVKHTVVPMIKSVLRNPDAMACMVTMQKKDNYTYNHSLAVSVWALVFGRHLGLDHVDLKALGMGGLLLDIGKTKLPSELLQKKGPLEQEEIEELHRHVEYGLQILDDTKNVDTSVKTIVRTHHERHDGSGYPEGLSGNDIPVFGRIAGIVDMYDAMTSLRPYAAAKSTYDVMRYLLSKTDALFQGEIIERFIQVIGMFPTGTIVELNTGEIGIVVRQNSVRRLRPEVMLVLDRDKNRRKDFPILDLKKMSSDESSPDAVWIVQGLDFGAFGIDPAKFYL